MEFKKITKFFDQINIKTKAQDDKVSFIDTFT